MGKAFLADNTELVATLEGLVLHTDELAAFANEEGDTVLVARCSTIAISLDGILDDEINNDLPSDHPFYELKEKIKEILASLGNEVDNTLPGDQPEVDNSLPGDQPEVDNSLPEGEQPVDPGYGVSEEHPDQAPPGDQPSVEHPMEPGAKPEQQG